MPKQLNYEQDRVTRINEIIKENPPEENCNHYFTQEPFLAGGEVDEERGDAQPLYMMVDKCIHCNGYNQ